MTSIVEKLKASGFKPEKSTEGEFQPLVGIYATQFVSAKVMPANDKGGKSLAVEFKIAETLSGKASASKFNEFKKYLALEGDEADSAKKGVKWILNTLFTAGIDVPLGNSDEELVENIQANLGTMVYVNAYSWKPEDSDKARQMFNVMKEEVALKKAKAEQAKAGVSF